MTMAIQILLISRRIQRADAVYVHHERINYWVTIQVEMDLLSFDQEAWNYRTTA